MSQVVIETMRHTLVPSGIAVILSAPHSAAQIRLRRPVGIVRHDQIEKAVIVIIEPGGSDAERIGRLRPDSRLFGDISESSVSIVVIESVSTGSAKEEVFVAIVIEIAHRNSEVE